MDNESESKKSATSGEYVLHSQPFHNPVLEVFGTKAPPYASLPKEDEGADESDDMSMFDVLSNDPDFPNVPLKTGDDFEDSPPNAPLKTGDDFKDDSPIISLKTGDDFQDDSLSMPLTTREDLESIVQSLNANLADRTLEEIQEIQQAILYSIQPKNK